MSATNAQQTMDIPSDFVKEYKDQCDDTLIDIEDIFWHCERPKGHSGVHARVNDLWRPNRIIMWTDEGQEQEDG